MPLAPHPLPGENRRVLCKHIPQPYLGSDGQAGHMHLRRHLALAATVPVILPYQLFFIQESASYR